MGNMEYIRKCYQVPAKRGVRVIYELGSRKIWIGVIKSAKNGRLRIQFDGQKTHPAPFHPKWRLTYID